MMWANLLGSIWARAIKNRTTNVTPAVYVDDKSLRTRCMQALRHSIKVTEELDDHLGNRLNPGKIDLLVLRPQDRLALADLTIGGFPP